MNNKRFIQLVAVIISLLVSALGIFFLSNTREKNENGDLKIAASIFPIYDIAKNIAGENTEVIQVLPRGVSPHTYEPTIADQEKLSGVDILFVIGHDLDNWAIEMAKASNKDVKIVVVDKNIDLQTGNHHEHEEGEEEEQEEEVDEEAIDPHYWLSVTNAIEISKTIKEELKAINMIEENTLDENTKIYVEKLEKLREESVNTLSGLENKEIITFHDAFGYFAQEFGLEVVATIEEFPGKEPTSQYLNEVVNEIEYHNLKVIFKEPQLSDAIINALANDYNIEVRTLDPEGGLEEIDSYIELIEYNVQTIMDSME